MHRDLKPENLILIDKDDNVNIKIADFGLSTKLSHPDEKLELRCGTPGYVAPELLRDEGYNCSFDIFSAGVIFYVMLTGRPLFGGTNANAILLQNMKCECNFDENIMKNVSPEAFDLV